MRQLRLVCLAALLATFGAAALSALHITSAHADGDYASLVNPFIGTTLTSTNTGFAVDNQGQAYPGANLPFGAVQWSPDTDTNTGFYSYDYNSTKLTGYSLKHTSGVLDQWISFLPYAGSVADSGHSPGNSIASFYDTFNHSNESAQPGYYALTTNSGITTQLTAAKRAGVGLFTYPTSGRASLIIDLGDNKNSNFTDNSLTIDPANQVISGYEGRNDGKAGHVYFYARFDHGFSDLGTFNGGTVSSYSTNVAGGQVGGYVSFDVSGNATVQAQVGVSWVSVANAQNNLQTEIQQSFDGVRAQAHNTWNAALGRFAATGNTATDQTIFYTMLYITLESPNIINDENGQYPGWDGQVHSVASGHNEYVTLSTWDAGHTGFLEFLGFFFPNEMSDIMQSYVDTATQADGYLHTIILYPNDRGDANVGEFALPTLAYPFGATNFDTGAALTALTKTASTVNGNPEIDDPADYLSKGYVPTDVSSNDPVEETLSYALSDFAIAQFAQQLNNQSVYQTYFPRSDNWRKVFDSAASDRGFTGYAWGRQSNGAFAGNFTADGGSYTYFQEATSGQGSFWAPQNLAGLISAMGGNATFISRLDDFFTKTNDGVHSPLMYIGNEPTQEVPWEYDWAGAPSHTQSAVRKIQLANFLNSPSGLPGNNDWGATASWYVLSALGLYPEIPGVGGFALSSPLFATMTIQLENGHTLEIDGADASDANPYVQSLSLNGGSYDSPWLPVAAISNGGTLSFTLGSTATGWGSAPSSNQPPSFPTNGGPPPSQGGFSSGFEGSDPTPASNTLYQNDLANVGGYLPTLSAPESGAVTGETTHSGAGSLRYSGKALGAASNYAYMQVYSNLSVPVGANTTLTYWIYPQSSSSAGNVAGTNSTCVAIDLYFSDGSELRDSGAVDQHGVRVHPAYQCQHLTLDTWNQVTTNLGAVANGKSVTNINLGFDDPGGAGGYRGYVDDVSISG